MKKPALIIAIAIGLLTLINLFLYLYLPQKDGNTELERLRSKERELDKQISRLIARESDRAVMAAADRMEISKLTEKVQQLETKLEDAEVASAVCDELTEELASKLQKAQAGKLTSLPATSIGVSENLNSVIHARANAESQFALCTSNLKGCQGQVKEMGNQMQQVSSELATLRAQQSTCQTTLTALQGTGSDAEKKRAEMAAHEGNLREAHSVSVVWESKSKEVAGLLASCQSTAGSTQSALASAVHEASLCASKQETLLQTIKQQQAALQVASTRVVDSLPSRLQPLPPSTPAPTRSPTPSPTPPPTALVTTTTSPRTSPSAGSTRAKSPKGPPASPLMHTYAASTAILVFACNRAEYLSRALESVFRIRPRVKGFFPIFVSQDGEDFSVREMMQDMIKHKTFPDLHYLNHINNEPIPTERPKEITAYYKIARHYRWALREVFNTEGVERVIVLEDDIEVAPDFFNYFTAGAWLLDQDPKLWCVSAWNDNGKPQFVDDPTALYRSDFFPGLGWMLKKAVWLELEPKWPKGYWDDWMREPAQRKDRICIRPEISRTITFGKKGVSHGQFFEKHLKLIQLNAKPVPFDTLDLSYLLPETYDAALRNAVSRARLVFDVNQIHSETTTDLRYEYTSLKDFEALAKQMAVMQDAKAGIPRTAYKGVVEFRGSASKKIRVFLVPAGGMLP